MFKNKRCITKGINERIPFEIQLVLWILIDSMKIQKDYLQVFELSCEDGKQKAVHKQEQPPYRREYSFKTDIPFLSAKIFVIDDGEHSTMMLAEEY